MSSRVNHSSVCSESSAGRPGGSGSRRFGPADLRVSEANNLQVDESALTGESLPVAKQVEAVSEEASLAERTSMLYKGTAVTSGSGAGVAVATGMQTELGRIATLTEDVGEKFTPLERRLERLGRRLVWATLAVGVVVAAAGLIGGKPWLLVLETAIAMAVAAVPEGLPIVATIALARGMWRMAHRNALINRLSAVETLGATSIICTDKTGTLTENRMHVQRLELTSGSFALDQEDFDPQKHDLLRRVLETGVLCNNSSLHKNGGDAVGDPLEVAFLKAAAAQDLHRDQLLDQLPEVREEAFDPDTFMMATFHQAKEGYRIAVKGAPEAVLDVCTAIAEKEGDVELSDALRQDWQERNQQLGKDGFRVLALAEKTVNSAEDDPYQGLTLLGLAGLWDPPRKEVGDTLKQCREAGIRVIMVTGDHPATALSVARAVGLNGEPPTVMTGDDLKKPADLTEEQRQRLLKASIFARVSPEQKLHLISLHQGSGAIVAMTGDGVNDAPALQQADIGVAMGKRGTPGRPRGCRYGVAGRQACHHYHRDLPRPGDFQQYPQIHFFPALRQRQPDYHHHPGGSGECTVATAAAADSLSQPDRRCLSSSGSGRRRGGPIGYAATAA